MIEGDQFKVIIVVGSMAVMQSRHLLIIIHNQVLYSIQQDFCAIYYIILSTMLLTASGSFV